MHHFQNKECINITRTPHWYTVYPPRALTKSHFTDGQFVLVLLYAHRNLKDKFHQNFYYTNLALSFSAMLFLFLVCIYIWNILKSISELLFRQFWRWTFWLINSNSLYLSWIKKSLLLFETNKKENHCIGNNFLLAWPVNWSSIISAPLG